MNAIGMLVLETIFRAMKWPAFEDAPSAPWRDHPDADCLSRSCQRHESCARREAWCEFAEWFSAQSKGGAS